jgi:hypothetical protein
VVLRPKKLEIRKKKCENCARAEKRNKNKYCAMNESTEVIDERYFFT